PSRKAQHRGLSCNQASISFEAEATSREHSSKPSHIPSKRRRAREPSDPRHTNSRRPLSVSPRGNRPSTYILPIQQSRSPQPFVASTLVAAKERSDHVPEGSSQRREEDHGDEISEDHLSSTTARPKVWRVKTRKTSTEDDGLITSHIYSDIYGQDSYDFAARSGGVSSAEEACMNYTPTPTLPRARPDTDVPVVHSILANMANYAYSDDDDSDFDDKVARQVEKMPAERIPGGWI
ncbi:MAG: hypothetical protein Q9224_007599, partial [Gallowayella concinna]